MAASPNPNATPLNYVGISLATILQICAMVCAVAIAFATVNTKIELANQRIDALEVNISAYQLDRKEDNKRIEDKLDKISARIDSLVERGKK